MPESFSLSISGNCFDISPTSPARVVIDRMIAAGIYVYYQPQRNSGCGVFGDLNYDHCVDRTDLAILLGAVRARSNDATYDLNLDGRVDIADARFLVLHFTLPDGSPCPP